MTNVTSRSASGGRGAAKELPLRVQDGRIVLTMIVFYPDIAVPPELETPFDIAAGTNQSVWVDVTIPRSTPPGATSGIVTVTSATSPPRMRRVGK